MLLVNFKVEYNFFIVIVPDKKLLFTLLESVSPNNQHFLLQTLESGTFPSLTFPACSSSSPKVTESLHFPTSTLLCVCASGRAVLVRVDVFVCFSTRGGPLTFVLLEAENPLLVHVALFFFARRRGLGCFCLSVSNPASHCSVCRSGKLPPGFPFSSVFLMPQLKVFLPVRVRLTYISVLLCSFWITASLFHFGLLFFFLTSWLLLFFAVALCEQEAGLLASVLVRLFVRSSSHLFRGCQNFGDEMCANSCPHTNPASFHRLFSPKQADPSRWLLDENTGALGRALFHSCKKRKKLLFIITMKGREAGSDRHLGVYL